MHAFTPGRLALAIALALQVFAAQAQSTNDPNAPATDVIEDEDKAQLDAVTVTARRREESLQDVPVAVSAFSPEDLRDLQARTLDGIQGAVPNLNIVQGRGSASSVNVFIRGIGQPDALQTFDPGVGVYVDDVYFSRIQGALFGLHDVQQVEVLRGPQGTLYGKNSTGGAIKLSTRTPDEESHLDAELGIGSFGRVEGKAYVAGELGNGVYGSLAALYNDNDGFVSDPIDGDRFNDDDNQAARIKLHMQPGENLKLTFSADLTRQHNNLALGHPEAPLLQVDLVSGLRLLRPVDAGDYDLFSQTSFENGEDQRLDHWGMSFVADWALNDAWRFKSITAYRELETDFFIDIDASEFELGDVFVGLDQDQFSQEFQLHFDNRDNVHAVMGLYYLQESVPSQQFAFADDLLALNGAPIDFLRSIDDDLDTTSTALFGQATWDFASDWSLSGGLRYSRDEKDYFRTTTTTSAGLPALNGTFAFAASESWDAWTPSLNLQRRFGENHQAYASANRGFKSGGFNGRANSAADVSAFDPEFVWTYELGWKSRFLDGRLMTAWSAFHSDYKNFQARVAEDLASFPVLNAAELDIEGLEFEAIALLGGTQIGAQIGWMDANYVEFFDARFDNADRSNDKVPFSPEWTFRLGATHGFVLGNGSTLSIGADAQWRDDTWLSVDNRPGLMQEDFWTFNAFARYETTDGRWQFNAGVKNLSNELYKVDAQEFASVGNIQTAYYAPPRNWYLSARYNF